jgi:alpha-beta hydrolase superfamily lysophospholipase
MPQATSGTELRFDVGAAVPLPGPRELAVVVHAPPPGTPLKRVLFCGHGGSYTRRYWDFSLAGHTGYSFAEALTGRGYLVVAWDDLCTGESSCPDDPWQVTSVEVAAGVDELARQVRERLAAGTLLPGLPPAEPPSVGVGHSLGGLLAIRRQARHRTHDALAILGWTNLGLRLTPGWWGEQLAARIEEELPGAGPLDVERAIAGIRDDLVRPDTASHRSAARSVFHWDDVPEDVLAADDALASRRHGTTGFIGQIPGIVVEDAATIDVPLFLGFGERDVSPDPWREPQTYPACRDLTLHVLPRSGHCHNFASTRAEQWNRLAAWLDALHA